jgi:hypothetical protein
VCSITKMSVCLSLAPFWDPADPAGRSTTKVFHISVCVQPRCELSFGLRRPPAFSQGFEVSLVKAGIGFLCKDGCVQA